MIKNQLIPRLGAYNMEDITKDVIQKLIIELRSNGRLDGKGGLSDKTVHDLLMVLKMVLRDYGIEIRKYFEKMHFNFQWITVLIV